LNLIPQSDPMLIM